MTTETAIHMPSTREVQWDVSELAEHQKVPQPKRRHAAPSAPWLWMDFDIDNANVPPLSPAAHEPWSRYPQSHFGNWTPDQVQRSRMFTICQDQYACQIHKTDVFKDGAFDRSEGQMAQPRQIPSDPTSAREFWDDLMEPLDVNLRVRALFIESITLNVLQILGARYNIEPLFFASSANWTPSRYQEDPHYADGDHITVVLPFVRTVNNHWERINPASSNETLDPLEKPLVMTDKNHTIDTRAPLVLSDQKVLLQDLLAIHMVRSMRDSVIISYHHESELQKTTARRLQSLVQRTGDSVYWAKIYARSRDPTFVFLAILWYALYAWDETLEVLHAHLSERLETTNVTTHAKNTRELYKLQVHLLYYQQLLHEFRKSVEFVRDTPNPGMHEDPDREDSMRLLKLESESLLSEIKRLEEQRQTQLDRLKIATALEEPRKSSPLELDKHEEGGDDLLEAEVPSTTPAREFDYDEPPSPASSAHPHLVGSSHGMSQSSDAPPVTSAPEAHLNVNLDTVESPQGQSIFKKWLRRKDHDNPASHKPGQLFGKSREPADHPSPSPSPTRTDAANDGPSWMSAGKRKRRAVAKTVRKPGHKSPPKAAVPKHPNEDASSSGQRAVDVAQADPVQQVIDSSHPPATRVNLTHQEESGYSTLLITFPTWMVCCRSGAQDGTH